jgi:hypothetical protein
MTTKPKTRKTVAKQPSPLFRALSVQQCDELSEIQRLAGALELAILGDATLSMNDRSSPLSALAMLVTERLKVLVEEIEAAYAPEAA